MYFHKLFFVGLVIHVQRINYEKKERKNSEARCSLVLPCAINSEDGIVLNLFLIFEDFEDFYFMSE